MTQGASLLLLVAALSGAPVQCGSENDPEKAMEETPGQALYELAEKFRASGEQGAWRDTLFHLIERYPGSRFAVAAKLDLAEANITVASEPAKPPATSRTAASPKE